MKAYMEVVVQNEAGFNEALLGLSFNKKQDKDMRMTAQNLAPKDYGHNKFLESIYVWLDVRAPRYWWQEADTFRLSTKQSESTMHTLNKELLALCADCTFGIVDSNKVHEYIELNFEQHSITNAQMMLILDAVSEELPLEEIKSKLPEGFLQRRLWCMNYKCLRNIIIQRKNHRLPHWKMFINQVMAQIQHPELLKPALL